MNANFIKVIGCIALSSIILLFNDYTNLGIFYFYFLCIFLCFDIVRTKKIMLLHIWNSAFLFIILSEVFSPIFNSTNDKLPALKFLIIANNIIFMGYFSKLKKSIEITPSKTNNRIKVKKYTPFLLISLVVMYFLLRINSSIQQFTIGRVGLNDSGIEQNFVLSSILSSLGYVLPALIGYYFIFIKKTRIIIPLLISSPIFLILFLDGTRFPLLFSFLGFIIVAQSKFFNKMNLKKYTLLGGSLLVLFIGTALMKEFRVSGEFNTDISIFKSSESSDLPTIFSNNASPEGVIDMTDLMFKHFETNDFKLGSTSSFLLYFWVPRNIWPEKPTMLGHWLVREYRGGFSSGHSASFGFTGELYSDFGLFSLLFIFLIGRLLKTGENFKNMAIKSGGYLTILGAMLFPYVFFFVRSPITASMNFLGILFFYFLIKRMIFSKNVKS